MDRLVVWALACVALVACGGGGSRGPSTLPEAAPSALSYPTPQVFVMGQAIKDVAPTVTGTVSSYSVNPALPAGLSLNTGTGTLSGTPTALSEATNYTVTATNAVGMTTAAVSITVTDAAPKVAYSSGTLAFTAGIAAHSIAPSTTGGGAVVSWSVSPALPAGLSFSTTDGSISGTPTTAAAASTYTVTAQNTGGTSAFDLKIIVESGPLLDLGHANNINVIRAQNVYALSQDSSGHWVLWDSITGTRLAAGEADWCQNVTYCGGGLAGAPQVSSIEMGGPTILIAQANGLESRSTSNGHLLGTINATLTWWKLATDGSYISGGSQSGLSVWTPSGQVLLTRPGDYSKAMVFAAPGELRVAAGAAGQNVVETISLPAGTAAVSAPFQGQFSTWFQDGERFLTTLSSTTWVYDKTAAQLQVVAFGAAPVAGGTGNWFWSEDVGGLSVYAVGGSSSPAATYAVPDHLATTVVPSGNTVAILASTQISVIDLSGGSPVKTDYPISLPHPSAYAVSYPGQWLVGNSHGVLLDGLGVGAPRYYDRGEVWSITGSGTRFAITTAASSILIFDTNTLTVQGAIGSLSSKAQISADGSLLAAAGDSLDDADHADRSIIVYSLPSKTPVNTYPYNISGSPLPLDFSLSGSGTALAQVLTNGRQVNAVPGGAAIWSDTLSSQGSAWPVRLSPDGTLIAAANFDPDPATATQIFKQGSLVTAVPGWAAGWIDDNRLLVNNYAAAHIGALYTHCSIYDATGKQAGCPAALPELQSFQTVAADSIYSPAQNAILSLTSGTPVWMSGSPHETPPSARSVGAVAGSHVVFVSGAHVLAESY